MRLKINDSQIIWPGKQKKKPEGIMIPTHLKVLTIEEKPFVYVRRLTDDEVNCVEDEVPCPLFNASNGMGKFKFENNFFNFKFLISFPLILMQRMIIAVVAIVLIY